MNSLSNCKEYAGIFARQYIINSYVKASRRKYFEEVFNARMEEFLPACADSFLPIARVSGLPLDTAMQAMLATAVEVKNLIIERGN